MQSYKVDDNDTQNFQRDTRDDNCRYVVRNAQNGLPRRSIRDDQERRWNARHLDTQVINMADYTMISKSSSTVRTRHNCGDAEELETE